MTATKDSTNTFDTNGNSDSFRVLVGSDISYSGVASLALTASGAILTYTGPTRDALVTLSISYYPSAVMVFADGPTTAVGIAQNGDLTGTAIYSDASSTAGVEANNLGSLQGVETGAPSLSTTAQRRITLASGDTIRPVAAKENGNRDLVVTGLTMSVFLL